MTQKKWLLQLVAAEERCALAETEIREEVSTEMAALLHDMEADYKVCTRPQSVRISFASPYIVSKISSTCNMSMLS